MSDTLKKSLTDLIDETLQELDELRKSRFAASEIKIEGPGDGIAGKPSNGDLHAKKGENEAVKADDDKDEDDDKKDMEKGVLDEAEKADKEDDKKDDDKKDDKKSDKGSPEHEEKEKKMAKDLLDMHKADLKKSAEESESLMKSYVEERVKPLEDKLSTILDLVNKIADQPVAAKGATARTVVTPLLKSGAPGFESLSKAEVASKLFELKKSGTKVDSLDITKAEMGQDLQTIVKKYEIS